MRLTRSLLMAASIVAASLSTVGDAVLHEAHAATCTPSAKGTCKACKNCKYCKHCAKNGGTCSVCK